MSDELAADTAVLEKVEQTTTEPKVEETKPVETKPSEADTTKATETATTETETTPDPLAPPDNWREMLSKGDEELDKILKRYSSPANFAKKILEQEKLIRSGKIKRDMPDPANAEAMAEWRKENNIPDDPSGYKLSEAVTKSLTDEDKPLLASFMERAHKAGKPADYIDFAASWYVDAMDQIAEQRAADDAAAKEAAEDALRKDLPHGEYKASMTLASRAIESIPGVGKDWSEFRGPDGRRLGDNPEFILWAADMGRNQFGDVTFANGDTERKHTARREEIEKIRDTDFDRYEAEGLDKEYRKLLEKDLARGKR